MGGVVLGVSLGLDLLGGFFGGGVASGLVDLVEGGLGGPGGVESVGHGEVWGGGWVVLLMWSDDAVGGGSREV